jgi:hypothetical protein
VRARRRGDGRCAILLPTSSTADGVITESNVPTANSEPWAIRVFGSSIWFTERNSSKIAPINASGQVLQEIPTPTANSQLARGSIHGETSVAVEMQ